MTNYNLDRSYSETLHQLQTTDRAHADTFNPLFNQLLNNDTHHNDRLNGHDLQLAESLPLIGVNTNNFQTTYDGNGNLTQTKELDSNNVLLIQTDITYNGDGTVHTITETFNGKQHVTTLNYTSGSLSTTNPFTRSVS